MRRHATHRPTIIVTAIAGLVLVGLFTAHVQAVDTWRIVDRIPLEKVWAGHPVGFCLITEGDRQFAAYYDADRRMTVASRRLNERRWTIVKLDEYVGWDTHNYITMAIDAEGCLHLSGNMHVAPLVYFRSEKPWDITTLRRVEHMVGEREDRCTYPKFLTDPNGRLVFVYRDGSSGNGDRLWNVYDTTSRQWRRLLDQPLTSGQGLMNAYPIGPLQDKSGVYHTIWTWRDTPDCATNHDLSYARSADLEHWTDSRGRRLELPITLETSDIIDPVPAGGGLLNSNVRLGFDAQDRPIASYHKYDEAGNLQLYNARLEAPGKWVIYQVTDWDYRWEFGGGGSINTEISFSAVRVDHQGRLVQDYRHVKYGSGRWVLDEKTLRPIGTVPKERQPQEIVRVRSDFPGMQVQTSWDRNRGRDGPTAYLLRWETLGRNRDRPRPKPWPEPSDLELFVLERITESR
ncbi:MAG: hypothetical protein D6741_16060 [Planctomycetota bacterium]|nr:MAG: hypothetical protein D6741_16060 [Planctomycetota bacterium]